MAGAETPGEAEDPPEALREVTSAAAEGVAPVDAAAAVLEEVAVAEERALELLIACWLFCSSGTDEVCTGYDRIAMACEWR